MAENKTQKTDASVDDYLAGIPGGRGDDARALNELLIEVTGLEPAMWGPSIVGYGDVNGPVGLSDTIAGIVICAVAIISLATSQRALRPGDSRAIGRIHPRE